MISHELAKRGHQIHVITQRLKGTSKFEAFEGINIHRVGSEIEFRGMLPPTLRHNLVYLFESFLTARRILKESAKSDTKKIDIIHSSPFIPVLSAHLISRLYRIPHIVSVYDVYQYHDNKFWQRWMSKEIEKAPFYASYAAKYIEKLILRLGISSFHTISEMSREDLINFGVKENKIKLIPPGIEPLVAESGTFGNDNQFERLNTNNEMKVVFIGRLIAYKNIDVVIKAFKRVVQDFPRAKLIIVGDGTHKEKLMRLSEPIKENIQFTGRIDQTEKINILSDSAFMVFPSLHEGFGIVILEAFACKLPVLVADVRPLSDIVKNGYTGYSIPPFDVDQWAEKMLYMFNDQRHTRVLGLNCYNEYRQKYMLPKIISEFERYYESTAS